MASAEAMRTKETYLISYIFSARRRRTVKKKKGRLLNALNRRKCLLLIEHSSIAHYHAQVSNLIRSASLAGRVSDEWKSVYVFSNQLHQSIPSSNISVDVFYCVVKSTLLSFGFFNLIFPYLSRPKDT